MDAMGDREREKMGMAGRRANEGGCGRERGGARGIVMGCESVVVLRARLGQPSVRTKPFVTPTSRHAAWPLACFLTVAPMTRRSRATIGGRHRPTSAAASADCDDEHERAGEVPAAPSKGKRAPECNARDGELLAEVETEKVSKRHKMIGLCTCSRCGAKSSDIE